MEKYILTINKYNPILILKLMVDGGTPVSDIVSVFVVVKLCMFIYCSGCEY